ncbi:uncharacterized protein NPIL_394831 [Nephila pilipes]|uniref:RanBP2-type domain-containing protein n=1 Tax=Nephila pilipes TaxID=299642 RepID=A0A8X6QAG4_NEPPI|nr:uncharacterized protein NPIL_394831 [Nephila pilipes]
MATGNVSYSFSKGNLEFSGPFNLNYVNVGSETTCRDFTSLNVMDNNAYADRELTVQVLDNNYPITMGNDNGNSEEIVKSISTETQPPICLTNLLKMNKNESQPLTQPQLIHSVIPEELTINIDTDEDCLHSWRPNSTNSLSADIFLHKPLFDSSPTNDEIVPSDENSSQLMPQWSKTVENKILDDMERIRISSNPNFVNNFRIDIPGHINSQKAQLNIVKYEVMNARRNIAEFKEAIESFTYKLKEKNMFENSQDIQRLSEENAQLRLECQCLCMEVDYYVKGQAPLGEVDEKFYGENTTQKSLSEAQPSPFTQCRDQESPNHHSEEFDESNKWECSKCTFANHPAILSCEMCHTSRSKKENPMFLASSSDTCYCHPNKKPELS